MTVNEIKEQTQIPDAELQKALCQLCDYRQSILLINSDTIESDPSVKIKLNLGFTHGTTKLHFRNPQAPKQQNLLLNVFTHEPIVINCKIIRMIKGEPEHMIGRDYLKEKLMKNLASDKYFGKIDPDLCLSWIEESI